MFDLLVCALITRFSYISLLFFKQIVSLLQVKLRMGPSMLSFTYCCFHFFYFFYLLPMPESSTTDSLLAQSSSESSIVMTLGIPMPTPGTPTTPNFKGKHVEDFLDLLEQHADSV